MALKTEDLIDTIKLKLDDLEGQAPKGATLNTRTTSQLAASQTMLSNTTTEEYLRLKTDLTSPESRSSFIKEQEAVRERMFKEAQGTLIPTLSNPLISDDEKMKVYQGSRIITEAIETKTLPPMSTLDILGQESLIADSGKNETPRSAESRNLMLESIEKVNKSKADMTRLINGLNIGKDSTTVGKLADVAEMFVPLAEWIHFSSLSKDVNGGKADGVLLGSQKEALYNKIKDLPISERAAFAEKLIETITENETIVLADGNDLVKLETLERMLVDNDYSDFEKYFDSTVGILDAIGVGALLRSGGKALKGAKVGAKLGREAKNFKPAVETSTEVATATPGLDGEILSGELAVRPTPTTAIDDVYDLGKSEYTDVTDLQREAIAYSARTDVIPSSPSQIVKDTNPEMSRNMHDLAASDETGEAAQALYGTTREEALAKDILPEPEIKPGRMTNKVEQRKPQFDEPENIKKARMAEGNSSLSDVELTRVTSKVSDSFKEITGMVYHPSSLVMRTNLDGSFGFTARYSPLDGGSTSFTAALDQAEVAFREYGLQKDNFTILAQRGDEWVEATEAELVAEKKLRYAGAKLDMPEPSGYAVGVKYDYHFRPEDLDDVELLTTGGGMLSNALKNLDRMPTQLLAKLGQGSILQNLLDPASIIHPRIVNPAMVATDKVFGLKRLYVEQFKKFGDDYVKLPKDRRAAMSDYIHQANLEGIPFSKTDLYSRGFSEKEVKSLEKWRRANDTMWYAANDDMAETLRGRGVKVFIHNGTETKLTGTPTARGSVSSKTDIFDPQTDSVRSMTKEELDNLYEAKGEVMELTDPLEINGELISHVAATNTPDGGFIRAIYQGEHVMHYREGYYPVMYNANFFIDKVTKGKGGKTITRAIMSAKDSVQGKAAMKALQESENLTDAEMAAKYVMRGDKRTAAARNSLFDEGAWNVVSSSGMSAQKFRGTRLGDAGSNLQNIGYQHLEDPLVAVAAQVRNLSQRVPMRKYMETQRKRFILSYGKYLDLPVNKKTGLPEMPRSIGDIKGKAGVSQKVIQDARTNFNYLYSLENGYINGIDEGYRAMMHVASNFMTELGWAGGERFALGASKLSPTQAAKTAAFKLFISGSPARQAIIQRGQVLQLGAVNPKYMATGFVQDYLGIQAAKFGGLKDAKYTALLDEITEAGVLDAVDAHTLIRDDQLRLADLTFADKAKSIAGAPLRVAQKIGFDLAEQDVLLTAWLAHRDLAIQKYGLKGIKNQRVKEEILGNTRAFTLGMNRGNELAHTQNTIGLVSQFFSFRQKAFLQGISNRNLSGMEKVKVTAYTAAMFGVDSTLLTTALNHYLGDDTVPNEMKDAIKAGMLDVALNAALTAASGEDQAIDFGDLAPAEVYGIGNVFVAMINMAPMEMLVESPSGSLLFGASPRITDAFRTGLKYFYPSSDYEDPELETTLTDVSIAAMSLFSGFSSTFKARYAYQTGLKMSGTGRITDADVTKWEAIAAAFGLRTKTEVGNSEHQQAARFGADSGSGNVLMADVDAWYSEVKRHLARRGMSVRESDMQQRVLSEAWRVFGDDREKVNSYINGKLTSDAKEGDFIVIQGFINKMGFMNDEETLSLLNTLPAGANRDALVDIYNHREGQK
jgi:hypothetical protein